MHRLCTRHVLSLSLLLGTVFQTAFCQDSERPTAPKLFPKGTLAYVRIDDVGQLKKDLEKSSLGKLGNDPQLKPIISEFYGSLVRNAEQLESAIGLNLDELLAIPSGEMAIALLPNKRASARVERSSSEEDGEEVRVRVQQPAIALLIDAGEEISSIKVLLQRIEDSANNRMVHEEKDFGPFKIHRYQNPERRREQFAYFIENGTMVASSDADYVEVLAAGWLGTGGEEETLSDNSDFVSIMSKCVGTEGERPQISFFVDPIEIVKQFTPRDAGSAVVLSTLPVLGLNGIEGIGGSWIINPKDFEAINHFHIQLKSPRKGLLSFLKPKDGPTTPEPWVPGSVASYATINWDWGGTIDGIKTYYNRFQGDDAWEEQIVQRIKEQFEIDLQRDVLDLLEGRVSIMQGFVRPIKLNSGTNLYAIKLTKPDYFKKSVLPKIEAIIGDRVEIETKAFGSLKCWVVEVPQRRSLETLRTPEVCFTVYEDYLLIADSQYMIRQVVEAINDESSGLAKTLEFEIISERISGQLQDRECSAISYSRPEETLQLFYELARDPKNRERLRSVADNNGFFKALLAALEKRELPPFSVISKYLAPTGGFLVDDETGMHYMTFSLRRE